MKHTLATLAFYSKYPGLYSFNKTDEPTKRAIQSLERLGYLKVNWPTFQAEHTGKVFSN